MGFWTPNASWPDAPWLQVRSNTGSRQQAAEAHLLVLIFDFHKRLALDPAAAGTAATLLSACAATRACSAARGMDSSQRHAQQPQPARQAQLAHARHSSPHSAAQRAPHARLDLAVWIRLLHSRSGNNKADQQGDSADRRLTKAKRPHGSPGCSPAGKPAGKPASRAAEQRHGSPPTASPCTLQHPPALASQRACAFRDVIRVMNSRADRAFPV